MRDHRRIHFSKSRMCQVNQIAQVNALHAERYGDAIQLLLQIVQIRIHVQGKGAHTVNQLRNDNADHRRKQRKNKQISTQNADRFGGLLAPVRLFAQCILYQFARLIEHERNHDAQQEGMEQLCNTGNAPQNHSAA